jgi:hypothetical protein
MIKLVSQRFSHAQKPMMASANTSAEKILHSDAADTSLGRQRQTSFCSTRSFFYKTRQKFFEHFGLFSKTATKRTPNRKNDIFLPSKREKKHSYFWKTKKCATNAH